MTPAVLGSLELYERKAFLWAAYSQKSTFLNCSRVRHQVLLTLVLVNGALTVAFATIGYVALKRMLQPLGVLTSYVERVREGSVEPIPDQQRHKLASEFGQLFDRFNAMANALSDRESLASRLAEQEKYAVLGKLASGMAHEVNNPLGGLFNALDTLHRYGADSSVRDSSLNLLHRGLSHIRNVVRSTLVIYRREKSNQFVRAADVDDLRLLIEPGVARRNIKLDWTNEIRSQLPVSVGSVRQATLNLLINACAATPTGGSVQMRAFATDTALIVDVGDEGPGLPESLVSFLGAGSDEMPPAGDGLGLWIVRRLVADERGSISVSREDGLRTVIRVTWPLGGESVLNQSINAPGGVEMLHAG